MQTQLKVAARPDERDDDAGDHHGHVRGGHQQPDLYEPEPGRGRCRRRSSDTRDGDGKIVAVADPAGLSHYPWRRDARRAVAAAGSNPANGVGADLGGADQAVRRDAAGAYAADRGDGLRPATDATADSAATLSPA